MTELEHKHPNPLQRFLARYQNRADTEVEQNLIRLAISVVALGYFVLDSSLRHEVGLWSGPALYACGYGLFTTVMLTWIGIDPRPSPVRRSITMVTDIGSLTYILAAYGKSVTLLYAIYLWVVTGNGLRYGNRYLIASAALAIAGFSTVIAVSPYWRSNEPLAGGLLVALVIIPSYVAVLGRRLAKALGETREANEAKRRFLANVSHEVYNPLHAMMGFIDLIREAPLTDEARRHANTLHAAAGNMLAILKDLLDISRIEAGRVDLVSVDFDLYQTVNSIAAMLAPQAASKGLLFTVHIDPGCPYALRGDPDRLRQVLVNLCNNAIKFTDHGVINLYVHGTMQPERQRTLLTFRVSDTGIGIPKAMQEHIFESFTQADPSIRKRFGGTGLGLTIAKNLVEMQGGRMSVDSREGEGTTFRVEIPYELATTTVRDEEMSGRVCAITMDPRIEDLLQEWLPAWGLSLAVRKSRPAGSRDSYPYETLVVDERCLTNTLAFPQRLTALTAADGVHRNAILIRSRSVPSTETLLSKGWSVVLQRPLDRRLLFNALHSTTAELDGSDTVVPITETTSSARSTYRVLAVDDSELSRDLAAQVLSRAGHHVEVAGTGEEALNKLAQEDYDLVLIDLNLPDLTAIEVLDQWRVLAPPPRLTQFVVLTGDNSTTVKDECLQAGALRVLHKPIRPTLLLAAVEEAVTQATGGLQATETDNSVLPTVLATGILEELVRAIGEQSVAKQAATFFEDAQRKLTDIQAAIARGDCSGIADIAHALQGNAAIVGASALATKANDLVRLTNRPGEKPATRECRRIFLDIRMLLARTRIAYRDYWARRDQQDA